MFVINTKPLLLNQLFFWTSFFLSCYLTIAMDCSCARGGYDENVAESRSGCVKKCQMTRSLVVALCDSFQFPKYKILPGI